MVYPLKLRPLYRQHLWGGANLHILGKHLPFSHVGESWELCQSPNAVSLIDNGPLQGKTLTEASSLWQEQLFGNDYAHAPCPLLVKFLDAKKQLSVQVHPTPAQGGKSEVWYIISAKPGATIIYGLREGVTPERIQPLLNTPQLLEYCRTLPVSAGQVYYIPPGIVHSLGAGIVAAEIQQSSDITYRFYDFGRKDSNGQLRPVHLPEALHTIDWEQNQTITTRIHSWEATPTLLRKTYHTDNAFHFTTLTLHTEICQTTSPDRFTVLVAVAGNGKLYYQQEQIPINLGDTLLLPAYLGEYHLKNENPATPFTLLSAAPISSNDITSI